MKFSWREDKVIVDKRWWKRCDCSIHFLFICWSHVACQSGEMLSWQPKHSDGMERHTDVLRWYILTYDWLVCQINIDWLAFVCQIMIGWFAFSICQIMIGWLAFLHAELWLAGWGLSRSNYNWLASFCICQFMIGCLAFVQVKLWLAVRLL